MTNKEWLDYLAHNAPDELAAWFDAEHVETANPTSHGDTAALEAKIAELTEKLRIGWECECRLQAERDELKAEHERIVQELVDANTRQCERTNELTVERDKLKELNGYHAAQYELASEDCDRLQVQVDELQAIADERWNKYIAEHLRADTLADDLLTANRQREQYRKLFGMALDWAHEITMLESSVDEGMA